MQVGRPEIKVTKGKRGKEFSKNKNKKCDDVSGFEKIYKKKTLTEAPEEGKAGKILLEPLGQMQDCHRTDWTDFHDGSHNAAKFAQTIPLIFLCL